MLCGAGSSNPRRSIPRSLRYASINAGQNAPASWAEPTGGPQHMSDLPLSARVREQFDNRTTEGRKTMMHEPLTVVDAAAWREWLDENESSSDGVWVTLAKKGTRTPTSLTYAQALDEALCSGWIDGRKNAVDAATYRQHFTPRRARSLWSKRNVELVAALIESGRMRDRGSAEIARAQADGRWDRAYAGAASITVPEDLRAALRATPRADEAFAALGSTARYPILLDVSTGSTEAVRARRIARHVARLGVVQQGE
jgi:uncharacterized protein YdeI (YjbR/CyaY-like superfamily)